MSMRKLGPLDWSGQFLLGETLGPRAGAQVRKLRSLELQTIAPLPVIKVKEPGGAVVGVLLGMPIDIREGRYLRDEITLSAPLGDRIDDAVESEIFALAGHFLFILDCAAARRVYLDAGGAKPLVYDPETRRAASTPPMLLDAAALEDRFEREMYDRLDIEREGWFPGGLTAYRGVHRLLPNHYLDLDMWRATRHWPNGPITERADPDAACAEIVDVARRVIAATVAEGPAFQTLTGGNETRILLACGRDYIDQLEFVTVKGAEASFDVEASLELAGKFDLSHRMIPVVFAKSDDEAEAWKARSGHCIGGPHQRSHPTVEALKSRKRLIGGVGGEVGRGFYWRDSDTSGAEITGSGIAGRFGMPSHPKVTEAIEKWLMGVPTRDAHCILDLAFLELRVGCWSFAHAYATVGPLDVHPLVSRQSFAAMMALPPDWRRQQGKTNRMVTTMIEHAWPELLQVPLGKRSGKGGRMRDYLDLAKRAAANPHLVLKKLRKMFG